MRNKRRKWLPVLIVLAFTFSLLFATAAFAITFTGKGCRGNEVCDTTTECDLFGNCNTQYSNCVGCGKTSMSCPDGIAYCNNKCAQVGTSAECQTCTPDCSYVDVPISDPHVILKFRIFTKKNFIKSIEPITQNALAGSSVNYKVSLANNHPKSISLNLGVNVPTDWTAEPSSQTLTMAQNSQQDFAFTVTSASDASDGTYSISFVAFSYELGVYDNIAAGYTVASRGAPTISVKPSTQQGAPLETKPYTVTVTNNDPEDFDPSVMDLVAHVPDEWDVYFDNSAFNLAPGDTDTTTMYVTPPETAQLGTYTINVNVTANAMTASAFAQYQLSFCGNGICEDDEVCAKDCIPETDIKCSGQCDSTVDDGVEFSGTPNFMFNNFLACEKGTAPEDCLSVYQSDSCAYGQSCLCGSDSASLCHLECVDEKGAYYLYAADGKAARTNSNYSFVCPYVNLPELVSEKNRLETAKAKYEQARSAFVETVQANASEKVKLQPCIDALGLIVKNLTAHLDYMDAVIESPAISNTTELRRQTPKVRNFIELIYNKYCRGAEGLLRIKTLTPPGQTEKGKTATATVLVENLANFDYYGYAECDYVPPGGEDIVVKDECTLIPGLSSKTFHASTDVLYDGEWQMKCRVFASLEPNCATEIHDETDYVPFNVYSKDVYVVDVSGECRENDILCSVRLNSDRQCAACTAEDTQCSFVGQENDTSYFTCPLGSFYLNMTGYAVSSSQCNPIEPSEKNITVHCTGCGDNITQSNEQCEIPNTNNNINCMQTESSCDGKRSLYRDQYGFCAPSCQCSADQYESACIRDVCDAECSDGETRNFTITQGDASCVCVQECNSTCGFADCFCEPQLPPSYEVLNTYVSELCPNQNTYIDVWCVMSDACTDCVKASVGGVECVWSDSSYWYGNTAVFANCLAGPSSNSACGTGAREVKCYVDTAKYGKTGTDKTAGIDVVGEGIPVPLPGECAVLFSSRTCHHNSETNDYTANVVVAWAGGNYSKAVIDAVSSDNYYMSGYSYTRNPASSGTKEISASVFDENGTLVCTNTTDVLCSRDITPSTTPEILGISVSNSCPEQGTTVDITCRSSVPRVDCIKASIGGEECAWSDSSYWFGNNAVFTNCAIGPRTNSACGTGARTVTCSVDTARCQQRGSNKTTGIDVVSATRPPAPAEPCSVQVTTRNCSYDRIAKKYNIYLGAAWSGGSYARGVIENRQSTAYTRSSFMYSRESGTAGTKQLLASVFDENDNLLCMNSTSIYCTPEAVGPTIRNASVEVLGVSVSDTCPEEKSYIDVRCDVSVPKVECIKAKIGNTVCDWTNSSYWYGSTAVFKDCESGFQTNSECGDGKRAVRCYIDTSECTQIGSDKTLTIDVLKEGAKPSTKCEIEISSKACSYNPTVQRYVAVMNVNWTNGNHAHGKIDEFESRKYTDYEFTYSYESGTPGTKSLKAYVHDSNNRMLCQATDTIYCGAGTTTGNVLDVIRDMPDVARPGLIDVKFDIIPYQFIQNFELKEYVEKDLEVSGRTMQGNTSAVILGGPSTSTEQHEYFHVYSWGTDLEENKNATISYKIKIDGEGEYHFIAKAKFHDQEKEYERYLFVTTCPQTTPVFAKHPETGDCHQFKTSCDAAEMGYGIVESCIEPPPYTPPPEEFDWVSVLIIVITVVVLVILWVKREAIKQRIEEWRSGKEEEPSEVEVPY